jgi:hypothetical protein
MELLLLRHNTEQEASENLHSECPSLISFQRTKEEEKEETNYSEPSGTVISLQGSVGWKLLMNPHPPHPDLAHLRVTIYL